MRTGPIRWRTRPMRLACRTCGARVPELCPCRHAHTSFPLGAGARTSVLSVVGVSLGRMNGIAGDLHRYLQESRDSVLKSLDGLTEYDIRRPMTPTATNLLGLVKHLAGVELGCLGDSVGRPGPVRLSWVEDGSIWDSADMWATADQSRDEIVTLYRTAWGHSDESIEQVELDAPAEVAWWPEGRRTTTFGALLVRVVAETAQHAGHADIVREMIDGRSGGDHDDAGDAAWWTRHMERVQHAADSYRWPSIAPVLSGGHSALR